jgi:hypothetical protein
MRRTIQDLFDSDDRNRLAAPALITVVLRRAKP